MLTVEVAEDPGVPPRRRERAGAGLGRVRLDRPGAGRGPQAGARLLVSLHRRRRERQPHRAHASPRRGRTTARPVNFAFVSCQDINEGKLNGYRRMIFEDERKPAAEQLGFVLHLGDFIYEVVQYPEEVKTRYDRTIYEVARLPAEPDSFKVSQFPPAR